MTRRPRRRHGTEAAAFHVFNRGHNRDTLFAGDEDRHTFRGLLARSKQRCGFRLFHSCLMTNPFHLLVRLPDPKRLSGLMAGLLRS